MLRRDQYERGRSQLGQVRVTRRTPPASHEPGEQSWETAAGKPDFGPCNEALALTRAVVAWRKSE